LATQTHPWRSSECINTTTKMSLRPGEHVLLQLSGDAVAAQLRRDKARSSLSGSRLSCRWLSAAFHCHPHLRFLTFGISDPFQLLLRVKQTHWNPLRKMFTPPQTDPRGSGSTWGCGGVAGAFWGTQMPPGSRLPPLLGVACRTAQRGTATEPQLFTGETWKRPQTGTSKCHGEAGRPGFELTPVVPV